jgi:ribosomal protein L32
VQKKNFQPQKFKNKNKYGIKEKFDGKNKTSHSTKFKKKTAKKKGVWHVSGDPNHSAPNCPNRFDKRLQGKGDKTTNIVIGDTGMNDGGYGIFLTVLSVCHSPEWWIDPGANVHVCADISMFSS